MGMAGAQRGMEAVPVYVTRLGDGESQSDQIGQNRRGNVGFHVIP